MDKVYFQCHYCPAWTWSFTALVEHFREHRKGERRNG